MTYSERELLQQVDFEKMSSEELERPSGWWRACAFPSWMCPPGASGPIPTAGASTCAPHCAPRCALAAPALRRRNPRRRHPPLVIICDISGSMSRYSRIVLHFMHAVTNDRDRVFSFLFGTRLTNITRLLRHRDVDVAVDRSPIRFRTGPAAPASAIAWPSSTPNGRAGCWARAPWCCSSATGSIGIPAKA